MACLVRGVKLNKHCSVFVLRCIYFLFLVKFLEPKIWIKHVCEIFSTVFVDYAGQGKKNTKSVVWYFSQYKVFSCSFIHHSLSFLCRLFYLFKYNENFMVGYLWYDYAIVIFLDVSMHQKYMLMLYP
jgi:hypothetical protein